MRSIQHKNTDCEVVGAGLLEGKATLTKVGMAGRFAKSNAIDRHLLCSASVLCGCSNAKGWIPAICFAPRAQPHWLCVGLNEEGQPAYVMYGENAADRCLTPADVPAIGKEVRGLHFGSYSLVVTPVADALVSIAAAADERFVSVDPNVRPSVEPDLGLWRMRVAE